MSNLIYLLHKICKYHYFPAMEHTLCDSNTRSIDLAAKKRLIFSCQNEIKKKFYTPMSKYISI